MKIIKMLAAGIASVAITFSEACQNNEDLHFNGTIDGINVSFNEDITSANWLAYNNGKLNLLEAQRTVLIDKDDDFKVDWVEITGPWNKNFSSSISQIQPEQAKAFQETFDHYVGRIREINSAEVEKNLNEQLQLR